MRKAPQLHAFLVLLFFTAFCFPFSMEASAAAAPTVATTLTDGMTQKGGKKTFDVMARSASGVKIASSVTLNGASVPQTWDDTDKTSYTLTFTKEGANTVAVKAAADGQTTTKTYTIHYQKANKGDVIGQAVWSVELFTIGCGYLAGPVKTDIIEGETAAQELIRLLHSAGYAAFYGGGVTDSFYLAYVADGGNTKKSRDKYKNSKEEFGAPASPKELNINPAVPPVLSPYLEEKMSRFDPADFEKGYLGEFDFTNGSGWMYCVNNNFPNVGFADAFLSDGDVVRVQFTMAYGADIGGAGAMGGALPGGGTAPRGFYPVADKDRLTALAAAVRASGKLSDGRVKAAYDNAAAALKTVDAAQGAVNAAYDALNVAFTGNGGGQTASSGASSSKNPGQTVNPSSAGQAGSRVPAASGPKAAGSTGHSGGSAGTSGAAAAALENTLSNLSAANRIRDESTGISVAGVSDDAIPEGAVLAANIVTSGKQFDQAKEALRDVAAMFSVVDISLVRGNTKIQPGGRVIISVPVPAGFNRNRLAVYRIDGQGEKTELVSVVKDDNILFETDRFSTYAIAEKAYAPANTPDDAPERERGGHWWLWLFAGGIVLLACMGAAVAYLLKLRKPTGERE